jgi:hypothetical protein
MSEPATLSPLRGAAAVAAIGAFLSFTNPFGATSALPLWGAFLYWTGLVAIGWYGGTLIGAGIRRVAPHLSPLVNRCISTALVSVFVTGAIVAVQRLLGEPVPSSYWPTLYVLVLGISAGVAMVAWLVERAFGGPPGAVTHALPEARVRFLDRLPPKLKGAVIYAVSSEDHYLRLHTSKGADLILMRLSDAVAELEGLEGAQTHRSWWVARDAVEGSRRDGDKVFLTLKGGVEAPVSRPNVRPLREAGWF